MTLTIIAEIGINHNGDMNICKQLIDVAAQAGVDAVKFQKEILMQFTQLNFWQSLEKVPGEIHSAIKKRVLNSVKTTTSKSTDIARSKG